MTAASELAAAGSPSPTASGPVVAEVTAAFEAYEAALRAHDVATMDRYFADTGYTRRFGVADEQRGGRAVAQWRRTATPVPPGRYLEATEIVAITADVAVATTRFGYGGGPATGRQSQLWVRLESGWQIVSAHVSELAEPAPVTVATDPG